MNITQSFIQEILYYNKDSGEFTWLKCKNNRFNGHKAGLDEGHGYIIIKIHGFRYQAHRLAWLYVYGKNPDCFIDHINGNRSDNRIDNLRDVSHKTNAQNIHGHKINNKCKFLGVIKRRNKFFSQIWIDGKKTYLGQFDTPEEAHQAYIKAKRQHHDGCTI